MWWIAGALAAATAILAGLGALIYVHQHRLLFWPDRTRVSEADLERIRSEHLGIELSIPTPDGVLLHGFFMPARAGIGGRRPTIIYCGGNAESLVRRATEADSLQASGWNLALVAYRGYGRSTGTPSARALLEDSLVTYDAIAARPEVDPERIIVWGRSLGSGMAIRIAAGRRVAGVILTCPYARLSEVAGHHYWWLPVRQFFRHEIDSLALAKQVHVPGLFLHGDRDQTIPLAQCVALRQAWGGDARLVVLRGRDHDDVSADPEYRRELSAFLGRIGRVAHA